MSKAPKASTFALFLTHAWIEPAKNQVNANVIRRGVVRDKETNATSNLVFPKYLEEQGSHVLSSVFTIQTSKGDQFGLTFAIAVNVVRNNCHDGIAIWRGP